MAIDGIIGVVLGGIGTGLSILNFVDAQRDRRSIIEFTVTPVHTPADDDDDAHTEVDGTPVVPAVAVTATNTGKRPITIEWLPCTYRSRAGGENYFERGSRVRIDKRLEQGGSCAAELKLGAKPMGVVRVWAIDSTHEKEWPAPAEKISQLNKDALQSKRWT